MKNTIEILALGILFSFILELNNTIAQETLVFTGYANNPVLIHGVPGSYDGNLLISPYALWKDEIFYLFYSGNGGICIATSLNGFNFDKYSMNPVFTISSSGFDSYSISNGLVLESDTGWVMYYNATDVSTIGPGPYIGRAVADNFTGIWERSTYPVLTVGSVGEWDAGFIAPNSIIPLDTGGFIMFYSGSDDFLTGYFQIGMATSPDGITWTKYNNPATTLPPFTESDPVLKFGDWGEWDDLIAWAPTVINKHGYYEMYYCGSRDIYHGQIGFAWSDDGITWEKWPANPVYGPQDDPYAVSTNNTVLEQPSLLVYNEKIFMYYDYGVGESSIGLATADVWVGWENKHSANYELQSTNYPNPIGQSTTISYNLKQPGKVTIQVFNSFGQLIAEPLSSILTMGEQKVTWNARNLPAGIYFYRIQAGKEVSRGKIIKR